MSGQEIFVIVIVALLLFGAEKLPEIAKGLGKGMRDFKKATDDIRRELEDSTREVRKDLNDVTESIKGDVNNFTENVTRDVNDVSDSIRSEVNDVTQSVESEVNDMSQTFQNEYTDLSQTVSDESPAPAAEVYSAAADEARSTEVKAEETAKQEDKTYDSFYYREPND